MLEPKLKIDARLSFSQVTEDFLRGLKSLEPFGMGNPDPVFHSERALLRAPPQILKGKHVKLDLCQGDARFEAIGFNLTDRMPPKLKAKDEIDLVYRVSPRQWMGEERIQLETLDLKRST